MRTRERGDGKLGLFIFLALIAAGIFFLVKWVPPRVAAYEFKDEMGRWNTDPEYRMQRVDGDYIKAQLLVKAQELGLPIRPQDLRVQKTGDGVSIAVSFDIPVDLKVTTMTQHYEFKEPKG